MTALGYLVLGAVDVAPWSDFAEELLGLQPAPSPGEGRLRWRVDEWSWRVEVAAAEKNGLIAVGWQVGDEDDLAEVGERMSAAGVETSPLDEQTCKDRGIRSALVCRDPAGVQLEIFIGPEIAATTFASPRGVCFVTGDQGLGHIVLFVSEYEECLQFYRAVLGFKTSDWLTMDGVQITFLHCNPRHHSLALAKSAEGPRLLHFMLQTKTLNDVGVAYDRCEAASAKLVKTIGLHANDKMVSFYVKTPSGFDVEYGYGGVRIDDEAGWHASTIPRPSLWGHKRLP